MEPELGGSFRRGGGRLTGLVLAQSRGEMKQGWGKRQKNIGASIRWGHEVVLAQCEGSGHQR